MKKLPQRKYCNQPQVKSQKFHYQISLEGFNRTENNVERTEFNFPLWFQTHNTPVNIMGINNRGPTCEMKVEAKIN
jgi:hypothetical protein